MTQLWTFLLVISLSLVSLNFYFLGRFGLLSGILLSFGLIFVVRNFSEMKLLKLMNAKPLVGRDPWGAAVTLAALSESQQCATPSIYLVTDTSPYSFSIRSPRPTGSVVLALSLLKHLDQNELRVVLCYHLLTLQEPSSLVSRLGTAAGHSLLLLGCRLDQLFPGAKDERAFQGLFAAGLSLMGAFFGRHSQYQRRDERVAEVLRDRHLVARTLWKLQNLTENLSQRRPLCGEHLLMVTPLTSSQKGPYWKSHPSLETRIRKLIGQYPI